MTINAFVMMYYVVIKFIIASIVVTVEHFFAWERGVKIKRCFLVPVEMVITNYLSSSKT